MSDVQLVQLLSGETLIGKVETSDLEASIKIREAFQLVPVPPAKENQNHGGIIVMPWFPMACRVPKVPVRIMTSAISAMSNPAAAIAEMYRRQTSDIILAEALPTAPQSLIHP